MRDPKLIDKFAAALPALARRLLDELLRIAEPRAVSLYLVGGPLRDLLLHISPSLDVDIAVEGDAPALARELAESLSRDNKAGSARPEALVGRAAATTSGPRLVVHPAFLTATVRIPGHHLDLITARAETYARPGALPTIKPATIREDLLRRDFTINALALRLNGPERGEVLDPTGGLADLDARLVRVLHERSFQDDATRILRAFRYATRLGFDIEPETLAWLKRDLSYLDIISATRLRHEFSRVLAEPNPETILRRLEEIGALAAIHSAFHFNPEQAAAFSHLRELHPSGARAAYWPALAWQRTEAEMADIARRLALTRAQCASLEAMPALQRLASPPSSVAQGPSLEPTSLHDPQLERSALVEILSPFPLPALWAFAALTDDQTIRDRLLDYLTKARNERPHLTGDDLLAMGVPQGPQLGDILRRLRTAKLDGETISREDEERLARRLLAEDGKGRDAKQKTIPTRSS